MGAFGAHGLRDNYISGGIDAEEARQIENWETAARYQTYHALALLAVGLIAARRCGLAIHLAGAGMTFGTLIFSGCLYALVLTDQQWLGRVVPVGGLLMIAGWICLAVAILRDKLSPAGGDAFSRK
jgi:uncharacterized membrane protein YgdD (TMEM256/DUF423 family)